MIKKQITDAIIAQGSIDNAIQIENIQWTKYHSPGGHGFAAEDANALDEKLFFKRVEKTGSTNEQNGSDRITNGISIQTKYYSTAQGSINGAFDSKTGFYRYEGQILEIPKDQYEEAINLFKEKIKDGYVKGVTDPDKAYDVIKKGNYTYTQAKNIAKAGNIDSLKFDIKNQTVSCFCSFGISFVIQYAVCIWKGAETKEAFKVALTQSLKSGALTLIIGASSQQLLRTTLGRGIAKLSTKLSRPIINTIYKTKSGKDAVEKMASFIFRKQLSGVSANTVTKLLRTNLITSSVSTVILSIPDFYKVLTSRLSWGQFGKNSIITVSSVGGGGSGGWVGAFVGSAVCPGLGTIIGGIVGGLGGALGASSVTKRIADKFIKDDTEQMFEIIREVLSELASQYYLTDKEQEDFYMYIIKKGPRWLEGVYKSGVRCQFPCEARKYFILNSCRKYFEHLIWSKSIKFNLQILFNEEECIRTNIQKYLIEDKKLIQQLKGY
jgi:hypothetical protein